MTRELIDAKPCGRIYQQDQVAWKRERRQTRDMQFAQNVSQVFLGINMKCASCHDSFIDIWTLQDAYDFAAVFSEEPLEHE